jgi:hypothetical protein
MKPKPKFHGDSARASQTRSCAIQAQWSADVVRGEPFPLPEAPARALRSRFGMFIKYFNASNTNGAGFFFVASEEGNIGLYGVGPTLPQGRAFPLQGNQSNHDRMERRLKELFLPITDRIRVFTGNASFQFESASWLEIS